MRQNTQSSEGILLVGDGTAQEEKEETPKPLRS
jgi:hypothetical protein